MPSRPVALISHLRAAREDEPRPDAFGRGGGGRLPVRGWLCVKKRVRFHVNNRPFAVELLSDDITSFQSLASTKIEVLLLFRGSILGIFDSKDFFELHLD